MGTSRNAVDGARARRPQQRLFRRRAGDEGPDLLGQAVVARAGRGAGEAEQGALGEGGHAPLRGARRW
ncbi:MAG: hypothetical protein CVU56_15005 [Deltaproteobacteria bacterium HGW-Deltaproteobacteria-14]|nr:MAG: hypothetical protein CVU56_15005 [Deltaproteobacteria bacterium HGW-Deltaproteobacteria-14]